MNIRHAAENDIPQMMKLYEYARRFMSEHGNPNQWGPAEWPPSALIRSDIADGHSYVCTDGGRIVGTFFFRQGEDIEPTYRVIEHGAWLTDAAYGVIHRLAGSGEAHGIGDLCLGWAWEQCRHLRADTHQDNRIMQHLLRKNGFVQCGIIHTAEDHTPRLAYEKCR